jgi:hypothetical protein
VEKGLRPSERLGRFEGPSHGTQTLGAAQRLHLEHQPLAHGPELHLQGQGDPLDQPIHQPSLTALLAASRSKLRTYANRHSSSKRSIFARH